MKFLELYEDIKGDLKEHSLKFFVKSYITNPSFRLVYNYRLTKYFSTKRRVLRLLTIYFKNKQLRKFSSQISHKAIIGKGIKFPHPTGIIIGDGVIIKDNVKIWQQVTLGSHGKKDESNRYPVIMNNVKIYAGAKIFGAVTIGENSIIGANAVVTRDVPPNSTAVGVPARVLERKNEHIS